MAISGILIMIELHFQGFQTFSSGQLVLKTIESRFANLDYYENGSSMHNLRFENMGKSRYPS